jgi:hypothetical protein
MGVLADRQVGVESHLALGLGQALEGAERGLDLVARPPVIDLGKRAQDEDGRLMARGAQRLDDRQTVEPGQHAVDDDEIEWLAGGEIESVPAVGRVLDSEAGLIEPLDQVGRGLLIVFDQEDTHEGRG